MVHALLTAGPFTPACSSFPLFSLSRSIAALRLISHRTVAPSSVGKQLAVPQRRTSFVVRVSTSATGIATMATKKAGATEESTLKIAQEMVDFINEAWTPFHAVDVASRMLSAAGFERLSERAEWHVNPGGKYYFTRNQSTLVAFAVGEKYAPGSGFYMVGAHTDSPCFKLKPVSKGTKSGYLMVNVEPYGGGLWHTWFDRDLGVAGRVLLRQADGKMVHRLVKIDRPILRIPMLAIHLNRELYDTGFKPNKQTQCVPVLSTALRDAANSNPSTASGSSRSTTGTASCSSDFSSKHHPALLAMVAKEAGCEVGDIMDFELNVCDTQPGQLGGPSNEFVFVGRLDNLASSFASTKALIDACSQPGSLADEDGVRSVALFDHEECGSDSAQGAGSPVMLNTIQRVTRLLSGSAEGAVQRSIQNSFLVSADMAHALHPNYADKHEPDHQPRFGNGLVIKHNVNQRYATNAISAALFREVARNRGIPTQEFVVRSDLACGSTIGPILASGLGCRTVDVGAPQLGMHSIREMCGSADVAHSYDHFVAFFEEYGKLARNVVVDDLPQADIKGQISDMPCDCTSKE